MRRGHARRLHHFPAPPTPLIGRDREVAAACHSVLRGDARLVTMTGPPGVGKTRLAIAVAAGVAAAFPGGAWFVPLAPIPDAASVAGALANTLSVVEADDRPLPEQLAHVLGPQRLLLVLDNFEHVAGAAALLSELLARCPRLAALVTSRTALRVRGERLFPVPPLAFPVLPAADPAYSGRPPADVAAVADHAAVALFFQRARDVRPELPVTPDGVAAAAAICRRLDGLPLAIELAAARCRVLSPQDVLARLERRLPLLAGSAPEVPARQRTLRGAIRWSDDLLDPAEQGVFRRLGVFVGGCPLAAAEAVCDGGAGGPLDTLERLDTLVGSSLVRPEPGAAGESRFVLLETIREYALERLEAAGETDRTRRRHAAYYAGLGAAAEPALRGPHQAAWLDRLELELHNVRAALGWALAGGEVELGLWLAGRLWRFWLVRGHLREGSDWLGELLARADAARADGPPPTARALAHFGLGVLSCYLGNTVTARGSLHRSLAISRRVGDAVGEARALSYLAVAAFHVDDFGTALSTAAEGVAVARRAGDAAQLGRSLGVLGSATFRRGDHAAARPLLEEALPLLRDAGDTMVMSTAISDLGHVARGLGDEALARARFEEALALRRALGDRVQIGYSLANLASLAWAQGDDAPARALLEESRAVVRRVGRPMGLATLLDLATALCLRGDHATARSLLEEDLARYRALDNRRAAAEVLRGFAFVAGAQANHDRALRLAGAAGALQTGADPSSSPDADAGAPAAWRTTYHRLLATARAVLQEAGAAAWVEGQAMSFGRAVAYALSPDDPAPAGDGAPPPRASRSAAGSAAGGLTPRERDVAARIAQGRSNRAIAADLVIAERTAARHVESILNKLGFHSRAQIAAWAAQHGLLAGGAD
jgi:predicted ATPase/DNA-binding CsgD family transcriptional regulator